jgi:hypothetical protein
MHGKFEVSKLLISHDTDPSMKNEKNISTATLMRKLMGSEQPPFHRNGSLGAREVAYAELIVEEVD